MAISNKMSILGTKKAVMAYNGGYYLPSVSDEGILSWSPTVEGMAPIPEVNVRGPQGSDASVTAEAIQAVVPIAWSENCSVFGEKASAVGGSVSVGYQATSIGQSTAVGLNTKAYNKGVSVGTSIYSIVSCRNAIVVGNDLAIGASTSITIGQSYTESVDGSNVQRECKNQGTGSITIGAGANTLNNGDVESSNSVTIGCKASNQGADSVVIGASASNTSYGVTVVGVSAKANEQYGVAFGANANASSFYSVAIGGYTNAAYGSVTLGYQAKGHSTAAVSLGFQSNSTTHAVSVGGHSESTHYATSLGNTARAKGQYSVAIGRGATVSDYGATVIRSTAEDGTYTQLYFSGANTPLANTYANGEAIMGYVTTDSEGNMVASGFKRLSALFDEGTMTQPAILNEDGEWEQPKVFKPSDVDMEVEEPSEPEEYQPLPVYPIVEPEIPEVEEV